MKNEFCEMFPAPGHFRPSSVLPTIPKLSHIKTAFPCTKYGVDRSVISGRRAEGPKLLGGATELVFLCRLNDHNTL